MEHRATIAYLEQRYLSLEKQIEEALLQSPMDELAIANLRYRKSSIAGEIEYYRRLAEHFDKVGAH